jgi:hypothetical protein
MLADAHKPPKKYGSMSEQQVSDLYEETFGEE